MNTPLPATLRGGLVLFGILAFFALLASGTYLFRGDYNSGDLYQHHAAGELWRADRGHDLYRGNILGRQIDTWQQSRFPDPTLAPRTQFNYLYPPLCAVLASTASSWSFPTWSRVWLAFSIAATLIGVCWIFQTFPRSWKNPFAILAVIAFPPMHYALYIGQVTPLTLLILAGAGRLLGLGKPVLAGCAASLLFYKPQLLPWLGLFMLLAGSWRFVAATVAGSLFWLGLGIGLAGFPAHLDWLACLRDMAGGVQFTRPGVNLSLRGMAEFASGGPGPWIDGVSLPLGIGLLSWLANRHRRLSGNPAAALALGVAACQVVSPYVCHYDYLLLLPWMLASLETTQKPLAGIASLAFLWLAGLLSIAGLVYGLPFAGILLMLWLAWTMQLPTAKSAKDARYGGLGY
jgi:hypothetical protein